MLQLLKWVYRRGVLAERARIKNILLQYRRDNYDLLNIRPSLDDSDNKADYDRQMRRYQISREAMDIVSHLLEPRGTVQMYDPAPIDSEYPVDPREP